LYEEDGVLASNITKEQIRLIGNAICSQAHVPEKNALFAYILIPF
jgi:hypothetical protein